MRNPGSLLFLAIMAINIAAVYILTRRGATRLLPTLGIGTVISVASFALYTLSEGNTFTHALIVGVALGVLFTGMTISAAMFFRTNSTTNSTIKSSAKAPVNPPTNPTNSAQ
jgi:membrane-associated HD superfamily phosphohydrolase